MMDKIQKRTITNLARLKLAVIRSSDIDLAILYLAVMSEYIKRNKDGQIDNVIDSIKKYILNH